MIRKTTIESAALSFARIKGIISSSEAAGYGDEYKNFVKDVLLDLSTRSDNCEFGLLWNAWTEKGDAEMLMELTHPDNPVIIHADSGGLQEITLGLTLTPEDKQAIYTRQGKFSTRAMSFDKMPIVTDDGAKNTAVDMSTRYFVRDMLFEVGLESGQNVLNQCKLISELPVEERKSKVLVIIQGSNFEDYLEYARGLFSAFDDLDEATKELYYEQIGGLSMGMSGVSNYFDLIDLILRSPVEFTMVPEHLRNEIHFLGIGGFTRVAPIFAIQDDFFGKDRDVHYTFDSTSRTSAATYGKYTHLVEKEEGIYTKKTLQLGREYNKTVEMHVNRLYETYKHLFAKHLTDKPLKDVEDFRENFTPYRKDGLRLSSQMIKSGMSEEEARYMRLGVTLVSDFLHWSSEVIQFYKILDMYANKNFDVLGKAQYRKAIYHLSKVETYEDYMQEKNRGYLKLVLTEMKMSEINIVETKSDIKHKRAITIDDEEW
jgi:hypothetical protein